MALIISNIFPLYGVLFLNWTVFSVLILYWMESAVIGIYNVLKIFNAKTSLPTPVSNNFFNSKISKIFLTFFFMFHYGIFMLVHGIFIFVIFGSGGLLNIFFSDISFKGFEIPFLFLLISHGLSYKINFLGKKEFLRIPAISLMTKPYARIFLMHLTIIATAFALILFGGSTTIGLMILIGLKTIVDLRAHRKEHG